MIKYTCSVTGVWHPQTVNSGKILATEITSLTTPNIMFSLIT